VSAKSVEDEVINFTVNSTTIKKQDVHTTHEATYKSSYFAGNSTLYNNDLAILSTQMSLAASSTATTFHRYGEALKLAYVSNKKIDFNETRNGYLAKAYKDLGFANDVYYKYDKSLNDTSDTVAHGIASKKIIVEGNEYTLVNVTVRGSAYGGEWASNYKITNENGVAGAYDAGREVFKHICEYVEKYKLGKNTKFWICGLSRGASAANTAASFVDRMCRDKKFKFTTDNVYVYGIATPNYANESYEEDVKFNDPLYDNIYSIVYENDISAMTAPQKWGNGRYGQVVTLPTIYISGKNIDKIEKGKKISEKEVSKKQLELAIKISKEYNEILYRLYPEKYEEMKDKIFRGFAVNKDFSKVLDSGFRILGESNAEYKELWQGIATDIIPFCISRAKKYDTDTNAWVKYNSFKEYLVDKYGEDILNKAIIEGVYSQDEETKNKTKVNNLYNKGVIKEENRDRLLQLVDLYYGVRIAMVNYNMDGDFIKLVTKRVFSELWELIKYSYPIGDATDCTRTHDGEFYLAYLRNFDLMVGDNY